MHRKSNKHKDNVITVTWNKKNDAINYKTDAMSLEQAMQLVALATSQESAQNTIQECANIFRRDILLLEKH